MADTRLRCLPELFDNALFGARRRPRLFDPTQNAIMYSEALHKIGRFRALAEDDTEYVVNVYQSGGSQRREYETVGGKKLAVIDESRGVNRIASGPVVRRIDGTQTNTPGPPA